MNPGTARSSCTRKPGRVEASAAEALMRTMMRIRKSRFIRPTDKRYSCQPLPGDGDDGVKVTKALDARGARADNRAPHRGRSHPAAKRFSPVSRGGAVW